MVKLDIGCGKNKKEGFTGMDQYAMEGVDVVHDVRVTPWPFDDGSVDEVNSSHFVEHLTGVERIAFFNELYRVLKPGAKATITTPHWSSHRAFGDWTHQWPPVSEMFFYYLSRKWRADNAPHTDAEFDPRGHACDFEASWGYSLHPSLNLRSEEYKQFAVSNYKEAIQDMIATITKL